MAGCSPEFFDALGDQERDDGEIDRVVAVVLSAKTLMDGHRSASEKANP